MPTGKHMRGGSNPADDQLRESDYPRNGYDARPRNGYSDYPRNGYDAYSRNGYDAYSRSAYGDYPGNAYGAAAAAAPDRTMNIALAKKPLSRGKKAALGVVIALVVVLAGFGIGLAMYLGNLNATMNAGVTDADRAALTTADTGEPYYILLLGSDSREGVEGSDAQWAGKLEDGSDGLTDVMILTRIDEANKQVTMLSIPRDTPYQDDSGEWLKMNWAYYVNGGAQGAISEISEFTGVPISHYVEIHMSGLMGLIDELGGIEVDVPVSYDYHEALTNEPVHLEAGRQTLDGAQAEVFARERLIYEDGDVTRQSNVRMVIQAIVDKVMQKPVTELPQVIARCAEFVTTDYSAAEALRVITALGKDFTLYQGTGPTAGDVNDVNVAGDWYCYCDPEGWDRVLQVFTSGGDPSTVSYEGDAVYPAGEEPPGQ